MLVDVTQSSPDLVLVISVSPIARVCGVQCTMGGPLFVLMLVALLLPVLLGFHMLTHILEVEVSVSSVCKKFMLVISQPCWPTSPMSMTGLQGHEVVMRAFSSTRVFLVHQSVELQILCPSSGCRPKLAFLKVIASCWRDLLGRARSVDALIIPFVNLLASSCGLR